MQVSPHGHPFVHCGPDPAGALGLVPLHCEMEIPVIASTAAASAAPTVRFCFAVQRMSKAYPSMLGLSLRTIPSGFSTRLRPRPWRR